MNELEVGWQLELWRRKGIEVNRVGNGKLEITGDAELDIDQAVYLVAEHKQKILAYLLDEGDHLSGTKQLDGRSKDFIPMVCQSCSRMELVGCRDEVMAGCLYEPTGTKFRFGWKRIPVNADGCMWMDESSGSG